MRSDVENMDNLKIYVWGVTDYGNAGNDKDFLVDYWSGVAVVIAASENQARATIIEAMGYAPSDKGLDETPAVYEIGPMAFIKYGTG